MGLKRVGAFVILIVLISVLGIIKVDALNTTSGAWQDAGTISVSGWYSVTMAKQISTLTDIVDLHLNATKFSEQDSNFAVAGGHKASQIWVLTKNGEMTLLQAINSGEKGLCPRADISTPVTYSGIGAAGTNLDKSKAYHYATEVQVTINGTKESLQDAIDGGYFCANYSWFANDWSSCSGSCGYITQTRTFYCERSDGVVMDNSYCTGERDCDPSAPLPRICILNEGPITTQSCWHDCSYHYEWPYHLDGFCNVCNADLSEKGTYTGNCNGYYGVQLTFCHFTWGWGCDYEVWKCY